MDDCSFTLAGLLIALSLFAGVGLGIALLAGAWKMYGKAGQPGWGVLVPIYNALLMVRIVGMPDWTFLLFMIPGVNLVFHIMVSLELAKRFGRAPVFAVGIILLPMVMWAVLGFGGAKYDPPPAGQRSRYFDPSPDRR